MVAREVGVAMEAPAMGVFSVVVVCTIAIMDTQKKSFCVKSDCEARIDEQDALKTKTPRLVANKGGLQAIPWKITR